MFDSTIHTKQYSKNILGGKFNFVASVLSKVHKSSILLFKYLDSQDDFQRMTKVLKKWTYLPSMKHGHSSGKWSHLRQLRTKFKKKFIVKNL